MKLQVIYTTLILDLIWQSSLEAGEAENKACNTKDLGIDVSEFRTISHGQLHYTGNGWYICSYGKWRKRDSVIGGGGSSPTYVNENPKLSGCPTNVHLYAKENQNSVIYSWSVPTATDKEDGHLSVQQTAGLHPGSRFNEGSHAITYQATDKNGAKALCTFTVNIHVIVCNRINNVPKNSVVTYDRYPYIFGSSATIKCNVGYEMHPTSVSNEQRIKCRSTASHQPIRSTTLPICTVIHCPANDAAIKPKFGTVTCTNGTQYQSVCSTKCDKGYTAQSAVSTCTQSKTWSRKLPDCRDTEPPQINGCPSNIRVFTDKNKQSAVASWLTPTASDNSGTATLQLVNGSQPGSIFSLGMTVIKYKATDSENNESNFCTFFVHVVEITCPSPHISDKYMSVTKCSNTTTYTYGSTCTLSCSNNFPLIGNDTISCEKNQTTNTGYWDMGAAEPYCKTNPCGHLPAPANGAMSCAAWLFGQQCKMQCNAGYDIAFGHGAGSFVCSLSTGKYQPEKVPDCTRPRNPHISVLGHFGYYTGDCTDKTAQNNIKQNFIHTVLRKGFASVCNPNVQCNVNNVTVACGPIKHRTGRSAVSSTSRPSHEIRVQMRVFVTWYDLNSSRADTFNTLDGILDKMFEIIKKLGKEGNLTVNGLAPNMQSFYKDYSSLECESGFAPVYTSLSCAPCSSGSYLNNADMTCTSCPMGTYKDKPESVECTACPIGSSTLAEGARNISDCIAVECPSGTFSSNGKCKLCGIGTYQANSGKSTCIRCPSGYITRHAGSSSQSDCISVYQMVSNSTGDGH